MSLATYDAITASAATGRKSAVRAQQAWIYLIGRAVNRQLVRYGDLAELMGYSDNRPLSPILGHLMHYCSQYGLPPITVIVVNRDGSPGEGFTDVPRVEFDRAREDVFAHEWFHMPPPSIEDLAAAWKKATGIKRTSDV